MKYLRWQNLKKLRIGFQIKYSFILCQLAFALSAVPHILASEYYSCGINVNICVPELLWWLLLSKPLLKKLPTLFIWHFQLRLTDISKLANAGYANANVNSARPVQQNGALCPAYLMTGGQQFYSLTITTRVIYSVKEF